jgi:5-methylcytosine-specific restriction enzyme A
MNEKEIRRICNQALERIGVAVRGAKDPTNPRSGLSFWFENYNRSNGPIFSIRPSGLKRHIISVKFGVYASACIDHISTRATTEAYSVAYALVKQLDHQFDTRLNKGELVSNWKVDRDFQLVVERKILDQRNDSEVIESAILVMMPLIAAMAELIGYEEIDEEIEGVREGSITEVLVRKRERNPRSRMLCLSIHGEFCGVCGVNPKELYSLHNKLILEVHHIEPLSEATSARVYDPAIDLIPLCPNCHRAIHTRIPAYTPEELKDLLL